MNIKIDLNKYKLRKILNYTTNYMITNLKDNVKEETHIKKISTKNIHSNHK